jgi:hypothetical protein
VIFGGSSSRLIASCRVWYSVYARYCGGLRVCRIDEPLAPPIKPFLILPHAGALPLLALQPLLLLLRITKTTVLNPHPPPVPVLHLLPAHLKAPKPEIPREAFPEGHYRQRVDLAAEGRGREETDGD